MKPFYILQLPKVAVGELLKHFNPFELLDLSQCSQKIATEIKLGGTKKFKLALDFRLNLVEIRSRIAIEILEKNIEVMKEYEILSYRSYENYTVPIAFDNKNKKLMYMFWDDVIIGLKTIGFHLASLFGCPINGFYWGGSNIKNLESFKSTIYQIIDKQSIIEDLDISVEGLDENEFKRILDRFSVTRELSIHVKLSPSFQYKFYPEPKMFWIGNSIWFTLNNLLATTCVRIELSRSCLTNEDVDLYLQKWKAGDYPKLEQLVITSNNFNDQTPILGMFPPIIDMINPKGFRKPIGHYIAGIYGGIDIQRNNGVKAKIKLELKNLSEFKLIVWN